MEQITQNTHVTPSFQAQIVKQEHSEHPLELPRQNVQVSNGMAQLGCVSTGVTSLVSKFTDALTALKIPVRAGHLIVGHYGAPSDTFLF